MSRRFVCVVGLYNDLQSPGDGQVGTIPMIDCGPRQVWQLGWIGPSLAWAGNLNEEPGIECSRRPTPLSTALHAPHKLYTYVPVQKCFHAVP